MNSSTVRQAPSPRVWRRTFQVGPIQVLTRGIADRSSKDIADRRLAIGTSLLLFESALALRKAEAQVAYASASRLRILRRLWRVVRRRPRWRATLELSYACHPRDALFPDRIRRRVLYG